MDINRSKPGSFPLTETRVGQLLLKHFCAQTRYSSSHQGSGSCSAAPKLGQSSKRKKGRIYLAEILAAAVVGASRPCWWWPQQTLGRFGELGRKSTTRNQLIAEGMDWGEGGKSLWGEWTFPLGSTLENNFSHQLVEARHALGGRATRTIKNLKKVESSSGKSSCCLLASADFKNSSLQYCYSAV